MPLIEYVKLAAGLAAVAVFILAVVFFGGSLT